MSTWKESITPELRPALALGAAITAALALLPGVRNFFILADVAGPLVAVAFAIRWRRQPLDQNQSARLGFLSCFYGLLLANGISDALWKIYELWKIENAPLLIGFFVDKVRESFTPSFWVTMIIQIVLSAIFAGIFGAPAGLLGWKLFSSRKPSARAR